MSEKCVCHIQGYAVKDATARNDLAEYKEATNASIASLESDKVPSQKNVSSGIRLYACKGGEDILTNPLPNTDSTEASATVEVSSDPNNVTGHKYYESVMRRDKNGRCSVMNPYYPKHISNKQYVDALVGNLEERLTDNTNYLLVTKASFATQANWASRADDALRATTATTATTAETANFANGITAGINNVTKTLASDYFEIPNASSIRNRVLYIGIYQTDETNGDYIKSFSILLVNYNKVKSTSDIEGYYVVASTGVNDTITITLYNQNNEIVRTKIQLYYKVI